MAGAEGGGYDVRKLSMIKLWKLEKVNGQRSCSPEI